ncbi:hypothetical protein [Parendozoicomonas sp. Alg238-R29]|uniref:hypothetical protein n=1 Tax=Parendozoicomonas sp. Alg238-R29 TaxID=2993446 RepID=UPI00248DEFCD|nr:hypothetical protein [Parendozoicomonas sp. Alg238-R29]
MEVWIDIINRASRTSVQNLFCHHGCPAPGTLKWDDFLTIPEELLAFVSSLPDRTQALMQEDLLRVQRMGNTEGQNALYLVYGKHDELDALPHEYDRGLWVYIHARDAFENAEMLLGFHQKQGKVRSWARFEATAGFSAAQIRSRADEFKDALCKRMPGELHCEVSICVHPGTSITQINIFRQQGPCTELEFDDTGTLGKTTRKPVTEFVILYDSRSGCLELIGRTSEERKKLATLVGKYLLDTLEVRDISRQQYDLNRLLKPRSFTSVNGIEIDDILSLNYELPQHRIKGSLSFDGQIPYHQKIQDVFGDKSPFKAICVVRKAQLKLKRQKLNSQGWQEIKMNLSGNSCSFQPTSLPSSIKEDIKNNCLKDWGLVAGIDEVFE